MNSTRPFAAANAGDDENTIEASFALLELCLEQLVSIAPSNSPQQILDLIPDVSVAARRLILVELIKFDLAAAAEANLSRSLEFYWPHVNEHLPQECIPFDLVLEEVQLRRAAGDKPRWEDYRQRFPDLADTIGKWLAGGDTSAFSGATSRIPELPIGERFDDFHVLKQLGQGAFARVYLARQESMHRLVALKATSRGSEEPQALSQLDHANVVRVYDQREIQDPPTILLYMQYLPGGTLADCIKTARKFPAEAWSGRLILESIDENLLQANQAVPEQSTIRDQIKDMHWAEVVAWIGIQLAEGLGYADSKGILHRDVKPANILLSAEAIPKLVDFNVSCSGLSGRAGAAAYFGGSLAYMSPEQLQVADPRDPLTAEQLDGRSDLYALGIVLWELWQGRRPWTLPDLASNWTEAVLMQRDVRKQLMTTARPANSSAERVLEKVLRSLLSVDPAQRPQSGMETAARLRLAFYPELANRFEPSRKSFAGRLLSAPVLLLSLILIFGPNTAASRFNYTYNEHRMRSFTGCTAVVPFGDVLRDFVSQTTGAIPEPLPTGAAPETSSMDDPSPDAKAGASGAAAPGADCALFARFVLVAGFVNGVVYPLGAALFLLIIVPFARIISRARNGQAATSQEISYLWTIGTLATLICAVLWAVSGVVFAVSMSLASPKFDGDDAFHFFMSLVLCGGVAWIYPYFGMTLLSLLVYYPKVIAPSMEDASFEQRCQRIRRHSFWYLLSAAAIPLTALGLLGFSDTLDRNLVLFGVCITAVGLVVAFWAHQKLDRTMQQYALVLGNRDRGIAI
jgi:serine/threonine protein kinase